MGTTKHERTAVEYINDSRQLLALVKERPCINPNGTSISRACAIGYAEITVIEKQLQAAVAILASQAVQQVVGKSDDFPRPMGATPKVGTWVKLRGYNVLQLGSADYIEHDGDLLSVNGDSSNEWNAVPFGIRWAVTKDNITLGSYGTKTDAVAVAEFRRAGLLPEQGE